jgi:glucokinase
MWGAGIVAGVLERGVIGVDLGGTKLLAGAVGADLAIHHRTNRPIYGLDQNGLVQMIADAVQEIRTAVGGGIEAVGFGIPCTFDSRTGMAVQAANAPLADIAFHEVMAELTGLPVAVDNDANCAVLCEARAGAAVGCSEVVLLTLGTGIGGGLVVGGRLVHGHRGAAAELGHIMVDSDGPPCPGSCPNHGCLEALVSGHAIGVEGLRVARGAPESGLGKALAAGREITGALVTEIAHDGDAAARDVMTLMGQRLGLGVVTLVNIFNPEVVVVGGGAIAAGELLLAPAREVVERRALPINRSDVRLVSARFGAESGMLGAACMALDAVGVPVG